MLTQKIIFEGPFKDHWDEVYKYLFALVISKENTFPIGVISSQIPIPKNFEDLALIALYSDEQKKICFKLLRDLFTREGLQFLLFKMLALTNNADHTHKPDALMRSSESLAVEIFNYLLKPAKKSLAQLIYDDCMNLATHVYTEIMGGEGIVFQSEAPKPVMRSISKSDLKNNIPATVPRDYVMSADCATRVTKLLLDINGKMIVFVNNNVLLRLMVGLLKNNLDPETPQVNRQFLLGVLANRFVCDAIQRFVIPLSDRERSKINTIKEDQDQSVVQKELLKKHLLLAIISKFCTKIFAHLLSTEERDKLDSLRDYPEDYKKFILNSDNKQGYIDFLESVQVVATFSAPEHLIRSHYVPTQFISELQFRDLVESFQKIRDEIISKHLKKVDIVRAFEDLRPMPSKNSKKADSSHDKIITSLQKRHDHLVLESKLFLEDLSKLYQHLFPQITPTCSPATVAELRKQFNSLGQYFELDGLSKEMLFAVEISLQVILRFVDFHKTMQEPKKKLAESHAKTESKIPFSSSLLRVERFLMPMQRTASSVAVPTKASPVRVDVNPQIVNKVTDERANLSHSGTVKNLSEQWNKRHQGNQAVERSGSKLRSSRSSAKEEEPAKSKIIAP